MNLFFSKSKRPRATLAGIFSLALSSVLLLCGAGPVPVKNLLPQGTMQGDLDAGGHNLTNAGSIGATSIQLNGSSLTSMFAGSSSTLPFLLGPSTHNYIFLGDSLTEGPLGDPFYTYQSWVAVMQGIGLGQAPGALMYNLGFGLETTAEVSAQYSGGSPVTTTLTTTSGSTTATVASATGISNGMCIGSAHTLPNTTLTISGTTVMLSQPATATGSVACSIATAPSNIHFGEAYAGGLANNWKNFKATAHQLSSAVSGIASTDFILLGANDYYEDTGSAVTLTCSTTAGSPNVTVTSGTFSGIATGCVVTSANLASAVPPYVMSGAGTANLVLSANATTTGSATTIVHFPKTAFATWKATYGGLVATAHADGSTVVCCTLPPAGNSGAGAQGDSVGNAFRLQWNAYIVANTAGADYVFDITQALPPYGSIVGSPYYTSDWLHFSPQGNNLLGRFFTQQFFFQEYTSQLAWNPFAVNALPDQWLSTNIPQKNQANIFNPISGCLNTTASATSGSATATVTGSTAGIYPGMYVSSCFGVNFFKPLTTVLSLAGTTLTLSTASNKTDTNATLFFSYSPFPAETVIKGDLYMGPALDITAGALNYVHFTSGADAFSPGILWENISGATTWQLAAPTSATGSMFLGNSANTASLSLASSGTITITGSTISAGGSALTTASLSTGNITSSGTETVKAVTISGVNSAATPLTVKSADSGSYAIVTFQDHSGTDKADFGFVEGAFYGSQGKMMLGLPVDWNIQAQGGSGTLLDSFSHTDGTFTSMGNIICDMAGKGFQAKEGSNAKQGTATLTAGTAIVSDASVTANSRIFLTTQGLGTVGVPKEIAITARMAGTSFTITSADNTDTSTVAYEIFEPAP